MQSLKVFFSCLFAAALAACGGGGNSSSSTSTKTTVTSTLAFPLQSGLNALVARGSSTNFTISGDCSGTATVVTSIPSSATFEGVPGVSTTSTGNYYFLNCMPSVVSGSWTDYYTGNYVPLGSVISGGGYGVSRTAPNIPATVRVGDAGTIGTVNYYTDSSKNTSTGYDVLSFVIEPDTASTMIANMIDRSFDSSGVLTNTEQDRYRMAADGTMAIVSAEIQEANGSSLHLVLTAQPDTAPIPR